MIDIAVGLAGLAILVILGCIADSYPRETLGLLGLGFVLLVAKWIGADTMERIRKKQKG